jgi:hypothetical protein
MGCITEEERKKRREEKKEVEGRKERKRERTKSEVRCWYSFFYEKNELCSLFFADKGERDRLIKKTK